MGSAVSIEHNFKSINATDVLRPAPQLSSNMRATCSSDHACLISSTNEPSGFVSCRLSAPLKLDARVRSLLFCLTNCPASFSPKAACVNHQVTDIHNHKLRFSFQSQIATTVAMLLNCLALHLSLQTRYPFFSGGFPRRPACEVTMHN